MLSRWERLPECMQSDKVLTYYNYLDKKRGSLFAKRIFDILMSLILIVVLSPFMLVIATCIKLDSKGPILYKQERVTRDLKVFKVCKFRTMVENADRIGSHVTGYRDNRITRVGHMLRDLRLDELPQLFNVLKGEMTFVGTRPEAIKYVDAYTEEMMATLLLPAGITSLASIKFKDEVKLLADKEDVDKAYIDIVLPQKMKYNLENLMHYSFSNDIKLMVMTVKAIFRG